MPEFTKAAQWSNDAVNKLALCAKVQVLPDGTQWEQSPMYHNEVLHCYLNVNYLAEKFNIVLPQIVVEKTKEPDHHRGLSGVRPHRHYHDRIPY